MLHLKSLTGNLQKKLRLCKLIRNKLVYCAPTQPYYITDFALVGELALVCQLREPALVCQLRKPALVCQLRKPALV